MSVQVEKLEKNMAKLTVEVSAEDFEKAVNTVYNRNKKSINIPGFRKGKAPRVMIEKMYGVGVFFEDAANLLINTEYPKAAQESELDIVSRPTIDIVQIEKGKSFIFTAEVAVKPEVTLGEYKGVEVEVSAADVTEEEVAAELKKEQEKNSRTIDVDDRAVADGDMVTLDFEGFVDGVAFEGGKGTDYPLTIGSNSFIPGFEEQLVGAVIGEEKEVNVTFPEDYHAEELAGKPTTFKVHIHEVKGKELPEFDDEFVKDISDFDTVEALRADMREKLEAIKKEEVAGDIEYQLMLQLNDRLEGEIPNALYEKQIDTEIRAFNYRLQSQGLRFETYMQLTGQNPQALRESFRQQAENQVKIRLALEKIAELENLAATDAEIDEEFENLAKMYKQDVEKVKELISREGQAKDVAARKAMNLVRDNAVVVSEEELEAEKKAAAEKKAPAKKPAAKKTTKKAEEKKEDAE